MDILTEFPLAVMYFRPFTLERYEIKDTYLIFER